MMKYIRGVLPILTLGVLLLNCRKKAFDEYYGRPENLAPPIYQQLQTMGNFSNLLACIDKAGYKSTLKAAGNWTMFAPSDSAFNVFFKERGITGVDQLDSVTCRQIVTYSLVYNSFEKDRLDDYQSSSGWVPGMAYKRRTAYYKGFYDDTTAAGQKVKALASNRNGAFAFGDNNNKYIPFFTDDFLAQRGLSTADYNYFYPNTPFSGFNVVDATVQKADIPAENGTIHTINKVLLPLPSIDKYLAANPLYSEFKNLLDKYLVQFVLNSDATSRFKLLTGKDSNVYIKMFNTALAFSPNNENYMKLQDNDAQSDGWTLFVPKNDVLKAYMKDVILGSGYTEDNLPLQIIIDLLNAHMFQTSVWPSKFATTNNFQTEPARFNPSTDIVDKKILSNGIFYGTNKVQQANVFSSIYGKPYLDPKYLLMTRALDANLRYLITVPSVKYTMIMMSDSLLKAKGFDYDLTTSSWVYTAPGTTVPASSSTSSATIQRILANSIIKGDIDLSGSGIVETVGGEYVKFNNGHITSAGTPDLATSFNKPAVNGHVYYGNDLLWYATETVGASLVSLADSAASPYYSFVQYLKNSPLYNSSTGDILGVTQGVYYTLFIPDNDAIQRAVDAGLLPANSDGSPNFKPKSQEDINLVSDFIKLHIVEKNIIVADGEKTGTYPTLFKDDNGDTKSVVINSTQGANPGYGSLQLFDGNVDSTGTPRVANLILSGSNNLADRAVIHLIDNYLQN